MDPLKQKVATRSLMLAILLIVIGVLSSYLYNNIANILNSKAIPAAQQEGQLHQNPAHPEEKAPTLAVPQNNKNLAHTLQEHENTIQNALNSQLQDFLHQQRLFLYKAIASASLMQFGITTLILYLWKKKT